MAVKDYCEELPKQFTTWVQFWDEIVKQGLDKNHSAIRIFLNEDEKLRDRERLLTVPRYSVEFVKNAAFEELLQDRLSIDEIKKWTYKIEYSVRYIAAGEEEQNDILETLGRVKRILLTQSIRK